MLNSLQVLIRFYRSQIEDDIEHVEQLIKDKAQEFYDIRQLDEITVEDETRAISIGYNLVNISMDIVMKNDTLAALKIVEDILYPSDPE